MCDRDVQLSTNQGCGQGGIDVAVHNYRSRLMLQYVLFEPLHDDCSLLRMGSGANRQVFGWIANSQLLEKNIRHVEVVVLAGMHKDLPGAARGKCAIDRRQLHEIRASPYDVQKISTSFVST